VGEVHPPVIRETVRRVRVIPVSNRQSISRDYRILEARTRSGRISTVIAFSNYRERPASGVNNASRASRLVFLPISCGEAKDGKEAIET